MPPRQLRFRQSDQAKASLRTAFISATKRARSAALSSRFPDTQDEGRVDRDEHLQPVLALDRLAAHPRHGDRLAEQRLRGGCAERDDEVGLDDRQLLVEPPAAGLHLAGIGLGMDAPLAARLELEMLDRVGDVDLEPIDIGLVEYLVEHLAGRPDEGLAGDILLVARLLADEDDPRILGSLAEHGLRGVAPQRAAAAGFGDLAQFGNRIGGARIFRPIVRLALAPVPGLDPRRDAAPAPSASWQSCPSRPSPLLRSDSGMSNASGRFRQRASLAGDRALREV